MDIYDSVKAAWSVWIAWLEMTEKCLQWSIWIYMISRSKLTSKQVRGCCRFNHGSCTNNKQPQTTCFVLFHGFEMHRCLTSHSMAPERLIPPPAAANTTHRAPHQKISKMRAFGSDALPGAGSFHTARQCGIVTFIAPLAMWHWDICACVLMCLVCPGALACCWLHRPSRI